MRSKIISYFLACCCLLVTYTLHAQGFTLVTSAGGFASSGDMHLSYSLGEPVIEYAQNGDTWLTQGYQQPGHMALMVSTDESTVWRHIALYPNPASGEITLVGVEPGECDLLQVYNTVGQPVLSAHLVSSKQRIAIDALHPGLYFATLRCSNTQYRTTSFFKL
jgi:hypothetical protein